MEVYVDDDSKLTLHGLQQHYVKLKDNEKNRKLFELLDVLEFNQVGFPFCFIICGFFLAWLTQRAKWGTILRRNVNQICTVFLFNFVLQW